MCSEAIKYGEQRLPDGENNNRVVVILNPTANKRSAEKTFEKYCSPILNLAGIRVDIVKTESEGYARTYVESEMTELPNAIVVAGGDGTLSEVVTGLLRRGAGASCPVAVLPVGRTNSVAGRLFFTEELNRYSRVEQLTRAAMSVIRGNIQKKDVIKVEILPEGEETEVKKPIYALASIKWGAFRDAIGLRDRYWYYGGLREHAAILFNAFRTSRLNFDCQGVLTTTPPCAGCRKCYEVAADRVEYKSKNWWSKLLPTKSSKPDNTQIIKVNGEDVRIRENPSCGVRTERQLADVNEVYLTTSNIDEGISTGPDAVPLMKVRLGSAKVDTLDWIQDSWRRTSNELVSRLPGETVESRTMELIPEQRTKPDGSEEFYSIDNEGYEVKPIRVTLLPAQIHLLT